MSLAQTSLLATALRRGVLVTLALALLLPAASATAVIDVDALRDAAEQCAAAGLPGECLATKGCHWCCQDPLRSPCYLPLDEGLVSLLLAPGAGRSSTNHNSTRVRDAATGVEDFSIRSSCPAAAILSTPGTTCGDLCGRDMLDTCEACEARPWCYYCSPSRTCQAPDVYCPFNDIHQQCTVPEDRTGEQEAARWRTALLVISATCALIVLITGAALVFNCVRERRRQAEQLEARRRRREERNRQRLQEQEAQAAALAAALGAVQGLEPPIGDPSHGEGDERQPLLAPAEARGEREAPMSSRVSTIPENEAVCYLCLDARPSVTFLPCYHTCCCEACSNRLRPRGNEVDCPFCRCKIEAMVSLSNILHHRAP